MIGIRIAVDIIEESDVVDMICDDSGQWRSPSEPPPEPPDNLAILD